MRLDLTQLQPISKEEQATDNQQGLDAAIKAKVLETLKKNENNVSKTCKDLAITRPRFNRIMAGENLTHYVRSNKLKGRLTQRQREIVDGIMQGKRNKDIALALGVQVKTVKFHISNIFKTLEVSNRFELIQKVNGLV